MLVDFKAYLEEQKIRYTPEEIEANRDLLVRALNDEIVHQVFGEAEARRRSIATDPQIRKALELAPKAEQLLHDPAAVRGRVRERQEAGPAPGRAIGDGTPPGPAVLSSRNFESPSSSLSARRTAMFSRIGRFFKAIFNAILGEAEGQIPVAMLEESVREMLGNLRSLREATATTIAFETKAKRDLDAQNQRLKNLDRQAEEALKQGNEKLARRALQLQVEAKGTQERTAQTHKAAKLRADNSRAKLKVEEERVQGKIRQLGELKAINEMNQAQRQMQAITDEYNIDGAVNVFDKTASTIQEQADKLSAIDRSPCPRERSSTASSPRSARRPRSMPPSTP